MPLLTLPILPINETPQFLHALVLYIPRLLGELNTVMKISFHDCVEDEVILRGLCHPEEAVRHFVPFRGAQQIHAYSELGC